MSSLPKRSDLMSWEGRNIISIDEFSKEDFYRVLKNSEKMIDLLDKGTPLNVLQGKLMSSLFFEPSTRTRLSFHAAMKRLGGKIIGFSDPRTSSRKKGETTSDTIKMASAYSDVIVIRHPNPGAAKLAAESAEVPVINGGDGSNQHPTQTLLDLVTIQQERPPSSSDSNIDGCKVAFVGDLKYGRTVHSLCTALKNFDTSFKFIAPEELEMPKKYKEGTDYEETNELELSDADVVYVTRIQKERFPRPSEYERLKGTYVINENVMNELKDDAIVMHPLPRINEIKSTVDSDPRAVYFKQAFYGVPTRMALLAMVTGALEEGELI